MGSPILKFEEQSSKHRKNTNHIKMAFYIYEQPALSMEHFHPGFYQPLRSMSRARHWNLLEKLFDDEETACQSRQSCCSSRSSKRLMFKVSCQETMANVEIKIQFGGHKFKAENLDVQVINDNVLVVKAEDNEEKFERKFKLSSDLLVEKIESKFDVKEEDVQNLIINIPKDVKVTQVPIAMDE